MTKGFYSEKNLIDAGYDVNAKDMGGMTALLWAARASCAEIEEMIENWRWVIITFYNSISFGRVKMKRMRRYFQIVILLYIKLQLFSYQGVVI